MNFRCSKCKREGNDKFFNICAICDVLIGEHELLCNLCDDEYDEFVVYQSKPRIIKLHDKCRKEWFKMKDQKREKYLRTLFPIIKNKKIIVPLSDSESSDFDSGIESPDPEIQEWVHYSPF